MDEPETPKVRRTRAERLAFLKEQQKKATADLQRFAGLVSKDERKALAREQLLVGTALLERSKADAISKCLVARALGETSALNGAALKFLRSRRWEIAGKEPGAAGQAGDADQRPGPSAPLPVEDLLSPLLAPDRSGPETGDQGNGILPADAAPTAECPLSEPDPLPPGNPNGR